MELKTITRDAIGRSAAIGDLYDVRTDSFVDISVLNDSIAEDVIRSIKIAAPDVKCINTDTIKEKFEKLRIESELKASILANFVPTDGYAKYLKHKKMGPNYVQKSIAYTNANLIEELVWKENMEDVISRDAIELNLGTHFVCAITWGTKVVVSLEREDSTDGQNVGDELKQTLTALVSSIQGVTQTLVDFPMFVDVFADVLPSDDPPNTLTETEAYVKKTLKLMQLTNKRKGRQLTYTLMPLSALNDKMCTSIEKQEVASLDEVTEVNVCIETFEDIREALLQISHVLEQYEKNPTCIPVEQLTEGFELKRKLIKLETEIKSQLKKIIPVIRSGSVATTSFNEMFETLKLNLLLDDINVWRIKQNDWLEKIKFIDQLKEAGVQYVGIGEPFERIMQSMNSSAEQFYVLFFGVKLQEENDDRWFRIKEYFLQLTGSHPCVAIDLDVRPELALNKVDEIRSRLCLYQNGKFIHYDVYASYIADLAKCLAEAHDYEKSEKPNKRVDLQLVCPGSLQGNCEEEKRVWHCRRCNEQLSFGFDGHFYCHCGKAKCETFTFKCCSDGHNFGFMLFPQWEMRRLISEIPPMKELNILVLGVTGVGKSTWLNAFVNYLTYPSLKEATQGHLQSVTSSWFQLTDDDNKVHDVEFGKDENEIHGKGRSSTQNVRGHLFPIGNTLLRLIDTPGIGDNRGVTRDKENFAKILAYLRNLKEIHGICILLKPNESKLHILFEFCIKELLTHLHRSALKNIVFCFTHSRITFYKPGDTRVPLEELLKQNNIHLPLDPSTMYCMDNESFRFLCAVNQGVPFKDSVKNAFSESWNVTVEEIDRLLAHIKSLEPHVIRDTISLNDAKKNIICLTKPIADISANIQRNLTETEWKREMLMNSNACVEELSKQLFHNVTELKCEPIPNPRTVCGSSKCVKHHRMENSTSKSIEYTTICHDDCQLPDVPVEIVGDKAIKGCWAMKCGRSLFCRICKCSWDQHLHIKYIQRTETRRVMAVNVENQMSEKKSERQKIQDFIKGLELFKKELEDEQRTIIEASVKFGHYLSQNAIVPYNDVIGKYIDHLIQREKDKADFTKQYEDLQRLEAMQEMFLVGAEALKQAMMQPHAEELSVVQFQQLLDILYLLKHNGKQLKDAFEQASMCEKRTNEHWEQFHSPKQRQSHSEKNYRTPTAGSSLKSTANCRGNNRQQNARLLAIATEPLRKSAAATGFVNWIKRIF